MHRSFLFKSNELFKKSRQPKSFKPESMLNPPSLEMPGSVNQVCVTNVNARDSGALLSRKNTLGCVDWTKEGHLYNMNRLIVAGFALYLGKLIWIINANFWDMLFEGLTWNSVIKCKLAVYAPEGRNLHTFICSREKWQRYNSFGSWFHLNLSLAGALLRRF